ncbi:bacterioferritin-associated ferredoxin [Sphingomonas gellani]|uniref:Bacterioferritin-associated ferredoxin n=1 Tax=Sphingomonas gellani TaxID=1166340 RepID=A0A1H7ZIT6_9SPHN|nr:(2Fe-2S)-binding protein [Sphingomonas gellani]SEM58246.1 bacterioferritin-associated ferredoxin [Sphingomonas gellani]
MVVCICNAIRESQVRECARAGCETPCQAFDSLGRKPKCGQCAGAARAIINEERDAA